MASKKFTIHITVRVLLLVVNVFLISAIWGKDHLIFTLILLFLILITQTVELIYFIEKMNRELKKFLDAIRYGDYSVSFGQGNLGGSFKELNQSFADMIETLKISRVEKQGQTELLKLALENIRLGIIIIDYQDSILLINPAAREMLDIPAFNSWGMLQKKKPDFTDQLSNFDFEGKRLIQLQTNDGHREYHLDLGHISLQGHKYRLISFSDLKNEIEQKEIDAWHRLIRILSHEVMNSVTPVTSLSETIKNLLTDENGEPMKGADLNEEKIEDIIMALSTIIRRSKGMLKFVDEYRKLTKLPAPRLEVFSVEELLLESAHLMQAQAKENNVVIEVKPVTSKLALNADRKMIEQVLINLIGNSIHAQPGPKGGHIILSAHLQNTHLILQVQDKGHGIPEDILPSIFIPFFTTRKNGTGIGLTLSKNIMQLHKGGISVTSVVGEGTVFQLSFGI